MIISEIPYTEEYIETSCSQPKYDSVQLGFLRSYNVNIQVKVEKSDKHSKGMTTLTLREVPKFLVDAFFIIRSNIEKEGLFRKGGNIVRINSFRKKITAIYAGREIIPVGLNYLDICSLIKSFIKTLKIPLLYNHDLANKLLELAKRKEAGKTINGDDVQELFQPRSTLHKEAIPKAHIGTLGFLMRELYRVSQHSEKNGMTVQNLATIFGPTLFEIVLPGLENEKLGRKSVGSIRAPNKITSMDEARQTFQRAVTAVAILIERAIWIGLNRECYVSSQTRSSSATPLQRTPLSLICPVIGNRSSRLTTQHDPAMAKRQQERRSLGFLSLISPLPGRRRIRSFFLEREKSNDALASDHDHPFAEQASTSEETLNDFDHKTRHSSNLMDEREVQTVDKGSVFRAKDRSAMAPKLRFHPISAYELPGNFSRKTATLWPDRSPSPTKRLSTRMLDRRHFRSPIKTIPPRRSTNEFEYDDRYRNAIVAASSASELDMEEKFDQRPSVGFIAQNLRGLVRDRVDQFAARDPSIEASSGRLSMLSITSKTPNASKF